jgi:REP element-mobilizing transposase RayT
MSRPLRIEYPNAVYHVTSRGNAGNEIFSDERDRNNFLSVLGSIVKRYNWLCHAYCLMHDHYHLMVETPDANLSRGMRQLNGVYTQKYNRRHGRAGHVLQGRYKAILVEKESYLPELCRHVVLNPLRAGLVKRPEDWEWSSYRATAGCGRVPTYLAIDWVLGSFSSRLRDALKGYRKFVLEGIDGESPWQDLRGLILMEDGALMEKLKDLLASKEHIKEIPRAQRFAGRPRLAEIFTEGESKAGRNSHICAAHMKYGYTLKKIADHLGLHYTTVSKALAELVS